MRINPLPQMGIPTLIYQPEKNTVDIFAGCLSPSSYSFMIMSDKVANAKIAAESLSENRVSPNFF